METSIEVSREMHEKLKALKARMKAKPFEELLEMLVERSRHSPLERFALLQLLWRGPPVVLLGRAGDVSNPGGVGL